MSSILPGVYSLNPRTEDEHVTHDVLTGTMKDMPKPDAVLLILDSTNLSRHLVLAAPVLSLGLPTLVILNMADDLGARGGEDQLGGAGDAARLAGGAGERGEGRGGRQSFSVSGGHDARGGSAKAADGTAGDSGHPQVPGVGGECGQQGELSRARASHVDAAVWMRSFCIRSLDRWYSCWW